MDMGTAMAHFGMLDSYPDSWDEETKEIAFRATVTAGYYARGLACSDPNLAHVQHLCGEVIYERLAEIERRGWTARADKYLQYQGSAFSLGAMLSWAHGKRLEAFRWRKALAEKIANGGQTRRDGNGGGRFRTE
jgi:hypothetical protein